ncbi:uncharacterized mitochondrial protein-like protein [Tanacetum coccineum]|uniref:Uncharacterized mitochondrial protein-like protein n=1 Tax=Tanacetum coccineum TaxID=301880 RepID=A0ABQ5IB10_9ASTR
MVPRAVLMKSGLVSINTARQANVAHSKSTVNAVKSMSYLSKTARSTVKRPIHKNITFKNNNINQRVNTVRGKNVNTVSPKAVVNAVNGNSLNVVKASACWLIDESQVLLRVPRKNNMYSVYLNNIVPKGGLTCLFAKATSDESKLWNRRLGHLYIKTMNKLVKENLVRGLPSKFFENDQTCVACQKGKQHRASCKSKTENSISLPLHLLHMDLFGLIFVKSLMKKMYCLVVIDDFSRFTWVFFLAAKDETSGILKSFITGIENLLDHKVKVIRCDNGTEFKNREINQFCEMKDILRQFSVARTPQQNGVAEKRNRTLIEDARTMLADSKLPTTFWAEAVNTACYADEGFFVGYSLNSKAFRVFNSRTMIVEENLHIRFSENIPNVIGTQSNGFTDPKSSHDDGSKSSSNDGKKVDEDPRKDSECNNQEKEDNVNSTNTVNVAGTNEVNAIGGKTSIKLLVDPNMPALEDYRVFDFSRDDEDDGAEADMNNLDTTIQVSHIPTIRIYKDHPFEQVIRDLQLATQTRKMSKNLKEHGFVSTIQQRTNHKDLQNCLFACFLSQEEPKKIEEEVYVCQPPGFEDPNFPDRVYKVEKALYGLHQAPRAWYETLSTYLLDNGFQRGKIDKTLFIKRHKGDILLVQVYVDDIIFSLTKKQKKDGIFISQDKYVVEILKKFGFTKVKTSSITMETQKPLLKDEDGKEVDVYMYRSMIGSLMYLTSSRPDIMFAVCACARYQVNPKVSHLYAVKRIFRYLKGQPKLGLWYPKDSPFDLVAYTDSDYAGASLDKKSTTGGKAKKSVRLMMEKLFGMELELILFWSTVKAKTINGEVQLHALVDGKKIIVTESSVRRDLQLKDEKGSTILNDPHHTPTTTQPSTSQPQKTQIPRKPKRKDTQVPQPSGPTNIVTDEVVHKELGDSLVRATTTASSLEAEQYSGSITKTRSKATPNESSSLGSTSGGGPRCQETMGDYIAQTRFENLSKLSNDSLLTREKTKTTQQNEIASLKRRVKKLEQKKRSRTHGLKRLHKVGMSRRVESSGDEESLDDADNEIFDMDALTGDEVFAEQEVTAKDVNLTVDEVTLAQALVALKSVKPKVKGVVIEEPSVLVSVLSASIKVSAATTTTAAILTPRKGIVITKLEPVKSKKKDVEIMLDEEAAKTLQAEFDKEERLAREKAEKENEANVALIEEWDDIQAKIEANYELAQRL